MHILVTGAKGRLGSRLVELLSRSHQVTGIDIDELDITQAELVRQAFHDFAPELVIHCAAMTAVDACALNPDEALRINGFGTKNIALACREIDAALFYISTNEVFDGRNTSTILEYDPTHPINAY